MLHFLLIMAAVTGGFAARFQTASMARTMLGVAVMQVLLGVAIATASSFKALLFSGFFTVLWPISAGCFRAAAKAENEAGRRDDS